MSNSLPAPGEAPPEIADLVRRRAEARAGHNFRLADALKAEIEAAGWRVTDHGRRSSVSRAAPPTLEVDGETRYGSAAAVPSRLDEPAAAPWTVVTVAGEEPERFARLMAALRAHAPAGTRVVVVANDPSAAQEAALAPGSPVLAPIGGVEPDVLRTAVRLGYAATINIGLRRATGQLVLLADGTAVPTGDAFGPLAAALSDPGVAAVGAFGLIPDDPEQPRANLLHRLDAAAATADVAATASAEAGAGAGAPAETTARADVTALELAWLAFRRSELTGSRPMPLDERFVTPAWLDVWWTLRVRFGSPEAGADGDGTSDGATSTAEEIAAPPTPPGPAAPPARRAAAVPVPLLRDDTPWPPDRTRLNRRNMYRVLDAFGWAELS